MAMQAPRAAAEKQQILQFWWMLELFSPQKLPKPTSRASGPRDPRVIEWRPQDPLPWDALRPPKPRGKTRRVWRHTVYLGVYTLEDTYDRLHRMFAVDPDAYDERPGGQSACAALLVDHQGRYVPQSAVLSSALWAVGRIDDPGHHDPRWAEGFPTAGTALIEAVDKFEGARREEAETEKPPRQDSESILRLVQIARTAAGISSEDVLATNRVIIQSVAVSADRSEDGADNDFLNSFFLDDLALARDAVGDGQPIGAALTAYLTADADIDMRRRIDVIERPDVVDAGTNPGRTPYGRWPSNPEHALALSQQFAVNQALHDLAPTSGMLGVNGPPGTGKTTMLRDILAGNVVERARHLSRLKDPRDAFTSVTHKWDSDGHGRFVRQLKPELTGFEMVVASANNAAVENVTAEIPSEHAIHQNWRGSADYFASIATGILKEAPRDDTEESVPSPEAWGLVAAKLGNKLNRASFRSSFWFDNAGPSTGETADAGSQRMQSWLSQQLHDSHPHKTWDQAKAEFSRAERRVAALVAERREAADRLSALPQCLLREHQLAAELGTAHRDLQQAKSDVNYHQLIEADALTRRHEALGRYDRELAAKPGVLEAIFTLGRANREWRQRLTPLADELAVAERTQLEIATYGTGLRERVHQLAGSAHRLDDELSRTRISLSQLRSTCAADRQRLAAGYPDESWVGDRRELHAPWLDPELDAARSDLFLAALQLHQDFFASAAKDMLNGLRGAIEVVAGRYPHNLAPEALRAAWQLFFLVVPLVSTTFASVGRMFGQLGPETIGWLLIDEAGQAPPQYAVGAIWRAKRCVVVGDPLQLQPVVTIPQKVERDIAAAYRISSTWLPPLASVQTLADRIAPYGTYLEQGEDPVWVSAPLKVHRRCDDPMFTLCNKIAYNNIMVNGVQRPAVDPNELDRFALDHPESLAASYWADSAAETSGTHLQENQIQRLQRGLDYLRDHGVDPSQVIAISPFRAVADRLASLKSEYPGLRAGTIHTAQGREAPVVFLVLGGDPDSPGAKAWAASTVNLVNVAASRAQRRLYVIGDHESWTRHNYFRQLGAALPVRPRA